VAGRGWKRLTSKHRSTSDLRSVRFFIYWKHHYLRGLMGKEVPIEEIRKLLGIKKIEDKIPVSDFERAALKRIREDEKERVKRAQKPRVKA